MAGKSVHWANAGLPPPVGQRPGTAVVPTEGKLLKKEVEVLEKLLKKVPCEQSVVAPFASSATRIGTHQNELNKKQVVVAPCAKQMTKDAKQLGLAPSEKQAQQGGKQNNNEVDKKQVVVAPRAKQTTMDTKQFGLAPSEKQAQQEGEQKFEKKKTELEFGREARREQQVQEEKGQEEAGPGVFAAVRRANEACSSASRRAVGRLPDFGAKLIGKKMQPEKVEKDGVAKLLLELVERGHDELAGLVKAR